MIALTVSAVAQEVEIRRWNQLPVDQNFAVLSFLQTSGTIATDPVLQIEDARVDLKTTLVGYIRTFALFDKTARFELRQAIQDGTWSGTLSGVPTTVERTGIGDTVARFAINLIGGPPLSGKAYADYRAGVREETILGAALAVSLPTGQYDPDKLINLGANRFSFRPQIGLQHRQDNWVFEVSGTAFLFTPNNDFFSGSRRTQAPLYSADGSIEYDFEGGAWISAGAGVGTGARSTVDGVPKNDERLDVGWEASAGFPITSKVSFRASYLGTQNLNAIGLAAHTVSVGLQTTW
ncbi:MAG: transporter [Hyphomicrobiales bacterium]